MLNEIHMVGNRDYYHLLQVSPDAEMEVIRMAYRALVRKHHPDVHGGDPEAQERMRLLNEAYEVLGDVAKRKAYDRLKFDDEEFADDWEEELEEDDGITLLVVGAAWLWQLATDAGRWRWAVAAGLVVCFLALGFTRGPAAPLPRMNLTELAAAVPEKPAPAEADVIPSSPPVMHEALPLPRLAPAKPAERPTRVEPEPSVPPQRMASKTIPAPLPEPTPVPDALEDNRRQLAHVVRERYGVVLDWKSFTEGELQEQQARIETALDIKREFGVSIDWQGYELEELRDHTRRLALARQLQERYGVVLDGGSFNEAQLRDIESRVSLATELRRTHQVTVDWQGYTLTELREYRNQLQHDQPTQDGVTLDPAPRPTPRG